MAAESYLYSSYQQLLNPMHCLFWIRRSTGLLSIDFGSDFSDAGDNSGPRRYASAGTGIISNRHSITSLDTSDEELLAIEWLSLEQFHEICYWNLSKVRPISSYAVSASARINLGAVIAKSSLEQGAVTLLQYAEPFDLYPITVWPECGERMDDGQIRFDSHSISNIVLEFEIGAQYPNAWLTQANPSTWLNQTNPGTWLSQANHIFERLQVTTPADLESYALVDFVRFHLRIPPIAEDSPAGYLFTRPQEYFGCGPGSLDQPDHLADWSLHPSATDRLSSTEAEHLGFPPFHLTSEIYLRSWNASVYAGLRKFHAAKGFDPASQDIARHLGCPLYKLPSDPHVPLVHGTYTIPI
ncbi:hypothetical protein B0H16DRAFT_41860 [Mycena metata]|uniref:Uncharacterized protein n=1 Tax=Mycena metata TaxID=1033252 RepID=A0AAD7JZR4_9AGAR|nr:hypothetical protein B0H16DRAFT_41860 [Mycena metata]